MGIIRLLLACSVVMAHAGPVHGLQLIRGDYAVETFFIISGFYMALVLNEKYLPSPSAAKAYKLFMTSRLLRLTPVYLSVLALTLLAQSLWPNHSVRSVGELLPALPYWMHQHLAVSSAALLAATNLVMLGQDAVMYAAVNPHTGMLFFASNFRNTALPAYHFLLIPQAWSIGLEILFYIIAPFIVRRSVPVLIAIAAVSFAIRLAIHHFGLTGDPWSYRFFPSELCFFLLGALGYRAYRLGRAHDFFRPIQGATALAVAISCIIFFSHSPLQNHATAYLVIMAVAVPFIFMFTRTSKIDRWIGESSYPLYIVHVLVLQTTRYFGYLKPGVTMAGSLVAAILLMVVIDQPVERLRQRWIARRKGLAPQVQHHPEAAVTGAS